MRVELDRKLAAGVVDGVVGGAQHVRGVPVRERVLQVARLAGPVQAAARERLLQIAAGAHQAGERPNLVDCWVQRRRIRAEALECQPGRGSQRRQECVRIVQRERRQRRREGVRTGQRDGFSRPQRLIAEDTGDEVRERCEVGLSQRSEEGHDRQPILVERVHELLHRLRAHGRPPGREEIHDHQQRSLTASSGVAAPGRRGCCGRAGARSARARADRRRCSCWIRPRPTRSTRGSPPRPRDPRSGSRGQRSRTPSASTTCARPRATATTSASDRANPETTTFTVRIYRPWAVRQRRQTRSASGADGVVPSPV